MVNDPPGASPPPAATVPLSIAQLREKLTAFGVRYDHCIEKAELVKLLKRAEFMASRVEFIATDSWQSVESFHLCPMGLQYEMDMKTGHTFAKLAPDRVSDHKGGASTPTTPGGKPRKLASEPSPCKLNRGAGRTSSSNATSGSHASGARASTPSKPVGGVAAAPSTPSTPLRVNAIPSRSSLSSGHRVFMQKSASQCEPDLTQRKRHASDVASRAYSSRCQVGDAAGSKLSTSVDSSGGAVAAPKSRAVAEEQAKHLEEQAARAEQQRRMSNASLFDKLPFETKELKGPRRTDDRRRSQASSAQQQRPDHRSVHRSERDKKPRATAASDAKGERHDVTRSKKLSHEEASRKRRRESLAEITADDLPVLTPLCPEPLLVEQCEPQLARQRTVEQPPTVERSAQEPEEQERNKEHKQRRGVQTREKEQRRSERQKEQQQQRSERQKEQQRSARERERERHREKRRRSAKRQDARPNAARKRSAPRPASADKSDERDVQTEQPETTRAYPNGGHGNGVVQIVASSDPTEMGHLIDAGGGPSSAVPFYSFV